MAGRVERNEMEILKRNGREVIEVLSRNLPEGTEEIHEILASG
jgi:hypothetical protein